MAIPVDPFQQPIPAAFQKDPEARSYFEFLAKWCHDMWVRSGGGTGVIPEYLIEVAKGNVPGNSIVGVTGANFDVDVANDEDIWGPGGTLVYPTAEEAWEVVSDSASDAAAGSGAQQVLVQYLDGDYKAQSETVTLSGLTPVPLLAVDSFRHQQSNVIAVGSGGENAGNISIRRASDSLVRSQIGFDAITGGENISNTSHYTVPANNRAFLVGVYPSVGKNKDIVIRMKTTNSDDGVFITRFGIGLYEQTVPAALTSPTEEIAPKSDIKFVGETANNNSSVSVIYQLLLTEL